MLPFEIFSQVLTKLTNQCSFSVILTMASRLGIFRRLLSRFTATWAMVFVLAWVY